MPAEMQPVRIFSPLARFLVLYVALYAGFGVISPFLPEFLRQRGLSAEEIGTVMALGSALRLAAAPLAGRFADRHRVWRGLLAACAGAAALTVLLYLPLRGLGPLLLVSLLQAAALAPLAPLSDALAVSAARLRDRGFEYGWVRGAGSAAFVAGLLAAGQAAAALGLEVIVWLNAVLVGLAAIAALPLPRLDAGSAAPAGVRQPGSMRLLLAIPVYRRLMLVGALVLGSHALHDTFAVIRWSAAGIGTGTASLLWSEAVAAEVVVFFLLGPALLNRIGPARAAALAATAGVVRWTVMGATADIAALALVQPLHGFTFALLHLAAMHLIGASVPLRVAATAQAIYGTFAVGLASSLLTFASGWLYAALDASAFWVMALLCAAAIPLTPGLMPPTARGLRRGRQTA
jgi:PPP family 3-phenylpropionic acid transporter